MIQTTARNASLEDIVGILRTQHAHKVDVVSSPNHLFSEQGRIQISGVTEPILTDSGVIDPNGSYLPTLVADEGIASKLGIPSPFLKELRATGRWDLYDNLVNGFLYGNPEVPADPYGKNLFLRGFAGQDHEDGVLRAVLSNSYKPMDNLDGLMATLEGIQAAGVDAQVTSADITDRRMVVRFQSEEVKAYAPTLLKGYRSPFNGQSGSDNPTVFAGFVVTNSETGSGAYSIVPRLVVQVCSNGMTIEKDAMRKVHLGAKMDTGTVNWSSETVEKNLALVKAQTADAVRTFLDVDYVTRTIDALENRADQPLDTAEEVKVLTKPLGYTKDQQDGILAQFIKGGQMTRGGVVNAITAYAQTVEDGDDAYWIESQATRVLIG